METYTVKQGDTLNQIANKYGYKNYKEAGLQPKSGNPDLIRPGETFNINPSATSPRDAFTSSLATGGVTPPVSSTSTDTPINTPAKTDYLKTYRDYLSQYSGSLAETPDVTAARDNLVGLQNKGDEQSLSARKAYEDLIHTSGGTKGGALEAGSVSNRNNSYILANLGVAESGASRKLGALTDAQTAKQNYLKTAADLSKPIEVGDSFIDPTTGEIVYQKPKADKTGIAGEYEYAKTQGYKGSFTDYQNEDANRKRVAAPKETAADKKQILTDDVNSAVDQLGQIVKAKGFKGVSPDDYNAMRQYLQEQYGYEGVKELDAALGVLGLTVDYGK